MPGPDIADDKDLVRALIYSDVIRLANKQMISPQAISGMMNHVIGMRIQSFKAISGNKYTQI